MVLGLFVYAIISGGFLYAFYKWAIANQDYFSKRNIKHLKPKFLVGNTAGLFMKRFRAPTFYDSMYYEFPNEKLIGFFDMRAPVYLARDLDFINRIAITDFGSFEDRVPVFDTDCDSLFGKSLFNMTGRKWREMRATLSPAFSSSKMRNMFELMVDCAEDTIKYLFEESKSSKSDRWEMKELFSRYTSDVIASCAFGLKVDSHHNRTNEFFMMGRTSLNNSTYTAALRLTLIRTFPKLMQSIDFEFYPTHVKQFFKSMVLDTMKVREEKQIHRPDMINMLMQVRNGNFDQQPDSDDDSFEDQKCRMNRSWTDDELVAQCFLFFAAGFATVSTSLSYIAVELALNQNIQQKLYEEIKAANESLKDGRLSFNTLSKLKYLDQVISEALRKWPPAKFVNRLCTKNYECNVDGNTFTIESGKSILIPINAIHQDPGVYENPKIFDPDRFNDENKLKIKPGAYIPFGIGLRNCIGSRFALVEMKALLFYLLLHFNIEPYSNNHIPAFRGTNTSIELGIDLRLKPRK